MTDTMGKKLARTRGLKTEAGYSADHRISLAELEKAKKDKVDLLSGLTAEIEQAVDAGREPEVVVTQYPRQQWLLQAQDGKATFQNLYDDFIKQMEAQDLKIEFTLDERNSNRPLKVSVEPTVPSFTM